MRVSIIVRACYRNEAISREIYAALCQVSTVKEIQVMLQENLILRHLNNKEADQTAHSHSLINSLDVLAV